MRDTEQQVTHISGRSIVVPENTTLTQAIQAFNKSGEELYVGGFILRYKAGLENCLIDIRTPSSKNNPLFIGAPTMSDIGTRHDMPPTPFKFAGKNRPVLSRAEAMEVHIQTGAGQNIAAGDVSLTLICIPKKQ